MQYGVAGPDRPETNHFYADLGANCSFKWERHAEFARYKLILPGSRYASPFADIGARFSLPEGVAGKASRVR